MTDLTDSTGATVKSYAYDAYGSVLESPGAVEQPYTYTGREFDLESGLYYYRARYYDPIVGRFAQKDPIGIGGGVNQYAYVKGNPPNRTDPSGLKEVIPGLGGEILGEIAGFVLEQGVGGVTGAVCASRYCKRKKADVAAFPSAYTECLNIFSQNPSVPTGARPGTDDFVYACAKECSRITKLPEFKKQCNCRE